MSDVLNAPFIIAILAALTVHEWAHAFVANLLGDHTAKSEGRMTLNPIAHLDPLGTLMFFLVHFGWGKPVPVDPRNFRNPRRDNALVALAGPASNFILAFLCVLLLRFFAPSVLGVGSASDLLSTAGIGLRLQAFGVKILADAVFLNLGLMAFNLLPIAPLDGSNVLHMFIPLRHEETYEKFLRYGPMILLGLLIAERMFNVPLLITWIMFILNGALAVMLRLVGA
ncbi:MAG: site-2 protease family protein [Candidatus Peribacteraceae bacterium]|nr:site-2 protease family protein [Candidatus Peribacteraceae bacterium]